MLSTSRPDKLSKFYALLQFKSSAESVLEECGKNHRNFDVVAAGSSGGPTTTTMTTVASVRGNSTDTSSNGGSGNNLRLAPPPHRGEMNTTCYCE